MSSGSASTLESGNTRALILATGAMMVSFLGWALIGGLAPQFAALYNLNASATAFLVAVPVLLGSIARLPVGMLTDRFGGRITFSAVLLCGAAAAWLVPQTTSYRQLIGAAFLLGIAGSSFAVGAAFVSRWTPPERQGTALGVYGLGNLGQSFAVFGGPLLAGAAGWTTVFYSTSVLLLVFAVVFAVFARNPPGVVRPSGLAPMIRVLTREPVAWLLGAFYFLTFGGFVAFSIYLPTLLRDQFGLAPADAGFRAAGFVVLATAMRPVGGWLADRVGGAQVLSWVFGGIAPFALFLAWPEMVPFTVGALACATLMGLGNGAVFKLVPQHFPKETGTVTGLVAALGGLGGFFPPLLLGVFRDAFGVAWPGFALLSLVAVVLGVANRRVFASGERTWRLALPSLTRAKSDQIRAATWATMWTLGVCASIIVGSRNLQNFDAALVVYTFAVIVATWGVVFHYTVWVQKPPTEVYWRRGFELARQLGPIGALRRLVPLTATHIVGQTFIRERSRLRWWMHLLLSWGTMLAVAITFPLVFGWIHFESLPNDQMTYVTYVFGFPTMSFAVRTVTSWLLFHGLDIAAVMVLAGISLSLWRRMSDRGAFAVQTFAMDFVPLLMLFAISVTGLALTVSAMYLRGSFYGFLAITHAITVIAGLLYAPFGKFFHIFQRPAQLGVKLYQDAGAAGPGAHCARCGERYTSALHLGDLKQVLPQVGFDYAMPAPVAASSNEPLGHWQDLCPACKRRTVAFAQLRIKEAARV
ncbi:MAG TPA: MFS transporter [Vicinamibacterales bacterium]|nr:MFS transporter [Vicinamibacterales bacterium]